MVPTRVKIQKNDKTKFIAISAFTNSSLAVTAEGNVYGWGSNSNGRIGLHGEEHVFLPVHISSLSRIIKVSCGVNHSLALDVNGSVHSCGGNRSGELGRAATQAADTS